MQLETLLSEMVDQGLISAETALKITTNPPVTKSDPSRAWYVRVLAGASAWIATVLFFIALGMLDVLNEPVVAFMLGTILLVLAFILRWHSDEGQVFRTQLALAGSLLGQLLLMVAAADIRNLSLAASLFVLLELLLFYFFPDHIHRFLSLSFALLALFVVFIDLDFEAGFHLINWLMLAGAIGLWVFAPQRWHKLPVRYAVPASYVLPIALLIALVALRVAEVKWMWLSGGAVLVGALVVLYQIVEDLGVLEFGRFFAILIILIGAITIQEPGILAAMTLLMLAFWRSDRLLMLLTTLFLLFFISSYYYRLDMILLYKSFVLAATGVVMLAAWAAVRSIDVVAITPQGDSA